MIKILSQECSEFVLESYPYPLLKNLPTTKDGFIKLKIRHKKNKKYLESKTFNIFNNALEKYHEKIAFKALYAYPLESLENSVGTEPFYIFPTNGYQYIYNPLVKSSVVEYNNTLSKLDSDNLEAVFTDIIRDSYYNKNLKSGIINGSEIIFFNIPYYYAIRKSLIESSYEEFVNSNY